MTCLNLGCGNDIRPGWINVDKHPPDHTKHLNEFMFHDLEELPLPFEDNKAKIVLLDNVLEHIRDPYELLKDVHRIMVTTGWLKIVVPHVDSPAAYQVNHRSYYNEHSLNPLIQNKGKEKMDQSNEATDLFKQINQWTYHRHPFCWHQRRYMGLELFGFGKQTITWVLEAL